MKIHGNIYIIYPWINVAYSTYVVTTKTSDYVYKMYLGHICRLNMIK